MQSENIISKVVIKDSMCVKIVSACELGKLYSLGENVDRVEINNNSIIEFLSFPETYGETGIDVDQLRRLYIVGLRKSYKQKKPSSTMVFSRNDINKLCGRPEIVGGMAY